MVKTHLHLVQLPFHITETASGKLPFGKVEDKSFAFSFTAPFLRTVFGNSYVTTSSLLTCL